MLFDKWGWFDTVASLVMAVATLITGWFTKLFGRIDARFGKMDERMDAVVAITVDQGREIVLLQAENKIAQARHEDNIGRLERIDSKQDAQINLLAEIRSVQYRGERP